MISYLTNQLNLPAIELGHSRYSSPSGWLVNPPGVIFSFVLPATGSSLRMRSFPFFRSPSLLICPRFTLEAPALEFLFLFIVIFFDGQQKSSAITAVTQASILICIKASRAIVVSLTAAPGSWRLSLQPESVCEDLSF